MSAVLDSRGLPLREALPPPRPVPLRVVAPPVAAAALPPATLNAVARASRGQGAAAKSRSTGLVVVVGVHALLFWALASGLAQKVVDVVRKPIDAVLVETPPPPPPPPKIEKLVERPKAATPPPPAYVPPPEVTPAPAPPAPTIVATATEPPAQPVVVAPPPPAPAPPAPAVVRQEVSLACPGYQNVLAAVLEEAIERVGITGTVRTRLTVRGGQVVDVAFLSGPKEYSKYVQSAVKRMKCTSGGADEVQVPLDVNFAR